MKKAAVLFSLFLGLSTARGQSVPSSCSAPDSVKQQYVDDADRMALRKIYRQGLAGMDSIQIAQPHSDTILNALLAVYNATSLPARDTVVSMLQIHTFPDLVMNLVGVAADSSLPWMHELRQNNLPSGEPGIDTVAAAYGLSIDDYHEFSNVFSWHYAMFRSDSNYNMRVLSDLFEPIPGVDFSEPESYVGDGNNIWDSVYADHVELIYSLGWGDCPAGCTARRFWKFNVYFDCSVEYVGSYGQPLVYMNVASTRSKPASVYPNPFSGQIHVEGAPAGATTFVLYNVFGQQVLRKTFSNATLVETGNLAGGVYCYRITDAQGAVSTGQINKQ